MACHEIVVIEDDAGVREAIRDLLEMEGYRVSVAENGREGLKVVRKIGRPCMVFLDLMMPVMNGWEFLEALRSERSAFPDPIPVTIVSAAADVLSVQQQYGCRVLVKPVSIDRLVAVAHEYCDAC